MTGSAQADCGYMFASGFKAESPVKGSDRNDVNQRNFQQPGNYS
jgi:hypothetical protein